MDLELYTDGACQGNPGPGGWAAVLVRAGKERRLWGFERATTNNRMELLAVIRGLEALLRPARVRVTTDSQYVKNAFTHGWLDGWQRNGWRTASGQQVKNQDLWRELAALRLQHSLTWEWVRGHSGHAYNELCDSLARQAVRTGTGGDSGSKDELPEAGPGPSHTRI